MVPRTGMARLSSCGYLSVGHRLYSLYIAINPRKLLAISVLSKILNIDSHIDRWAFIHPTSRVRDD